jgi:hypothetical protein
MPVDQPRGPNRAWKNQAAPGGAAKSGKRAWQKSPEPVAAGPKRPWSRTSKLFLATTTLSGIIAAIVLLVLWFKPAKPASLVLIGESFDQDLRVPHNVYGWQGLQDMAGLVPTSSLDSWLPWSTSRPLALHYGPKAFDDKQGWVPDARGISQQTVIIFLAFHGGSDPERGAYLVVKDPGAEPRRVPLKDVLKDLGTRLEGKNIVLLLDATQVPAHWPSGQLHNDFVHQLKELDRAGDIARYPNLVILCASDEDQRSWVSEEWRQTIFTHFVVEGLKGAADNPAGGGDGNSRVTALELHKYVRARVEAWAQTTHNALQQPLLLPQKDGEQRAAAMNLVQLPEPYQERKWDQAAEDASKKLLARSLDELRPVWEQCAALRDEVPSPAVYTPQLWRIYQDSVLRYEQLVRAGDGTGARQMRATIDSLRNRIAAAQALQGASDSMTNSFPMPAELGLSRPWRQKDKRDLFRQQFSEVWKAKNLSEELGKFKTEWLGQAGDDAQKRRLLLTDLSRLLVEKVATTTTGRPDLNRAKEILAQAEDLLGPAKRPTEAQYLALLWRDLGDKDKSVELTADKLATLRLALEVNQLAERTAAGFGPAGGQDGNRGHPYSEAVWPWIATVVLDADKERRTGQDYLFGPASAWTRATTSLQAAKKGYLAAAADAARVQKALELRDQVLAEVPYYARWLAAKRVSTAGVDMQLQALLREVQQAAGRMSDLAGALKEAEGGNRNAAALPKITGPLAENYAALHKAFLNECSDLADKPAHQWQYLPLWEAALSIPLVPPDARLPMLRLSRELTATSNEAFRAKVKEVPVRFNIQAEARDQGQMAVAITGMAKPWLDLSGVAALKNKIENLEKSPDWHQDIAAAGDAVFKRYRQMSGTLASDLKAAVDQNDSTKALDKLQGPEYLCRLVPGSEPVHEVAGVEAVEGSRRLRFYDLFLTQAGRTVQDHWFAESPTAVPYYLGAASAYVSDAERMIKTSDDEREKAWLTRAAAAKNQVRLTKYDVRGAGSFPVTETNFALHWKVTPEKGLPDGSPVFWVAVTEPIKVGKDTVLGRQMADAQRPDKDGLVYALQKARKGGGNTATATFHGLFRGQQIQDATTLNLLLEPEIHAFLPPTPRTGGISLRLSPDFTYGAVCLMLDCSGSMNEKLPGQQQTKIEQARAALHEILGRIPRGTYLSIGAFGHEKKIPGFVPADQEEATVIEWVREVKRWDKESLQNGLEAEKNRLKHLHPQNLSPIAESLKFAMEDGFPPDREYKGPKLILVLTDGDDNMFERGRARLFKNLPGKNGNDVPTFLKNEFQNSDVEIDMVCFADPNSPVPAKAKEAQNAKRQFGSVEELNPNSQFIFQPQPGQLVNTILEAIRPRLNLRDNNNNLPTNLRKGLKATDYGEDLDWRRLAPIYYKGSVQNIYKQPLDLLAGQLLNVTLKQQGTDVFFERGLLSDFIKENKKKSAWIKQDGKWYASVLQNFLQEPNQLRQLLTVEKEQQEIANQSKVALQQENPSFVWIELKAKEGKDVRRDFRWRYEHGYQAPAYRLSSQDWQKGTTPTPAELSVWWSENPPGEPQRLSHSPGPFADLEQPLPVGDSQVKMTVYAETRELTTGFGTADKEVKDSVPCLIVDIEHTPDKPVWLRADGLGQRGEEHKFYTTKGRYTAIFWGVSSPQNKSFQLTLIPLNAFKNHPATRRAVFRLDPPDFTDDDSKLPRVDLESLN